jgi:hypothetical protein
LRSGDFKAFFEDRTTRLLSLVGAAMGKRPIRVAEAPSGDDPKTFMM